MFTAEVTHCGQSHSLSWLDTGNVVGDRPALSKLYTTVAAFAAVGGCRVLLRDPMCAYLLMSLAFDEVHLVDGEIPPLPCVVECCH